uniref:Uncharacterized protein n=1 Tax=Arundo donax TaxID=35708 RepID=A0A0A9DX00_ARUDO
MSCEKYTVRSALRRKEDATKQMATTLHSVANKSWCVIANCSCPIEVVASIDISCHLHPCIHYPTMVL